MAYNPHPPYEILQNKLIDFATMQRLRRFARYWDMIGNSGNFVETTPLVWAGASPFSQFLRLSDWLFARTKRTDSITLVRLMELLFEFLTGELHLDASKVAETMWRDYQRGSRYDKPGFMKDFLAAEPSGARKSPTAALPKRQARHLV
jgi:hypothetical protein